MKQFSAILSLLLITFAGAAQFLQFKTYSVNDGLVSRNVNRIFQDSKGFLWIATWEGLSKYDGGRFLNFTAANGFPADLVNDIHEDASGNLLAAVNNGSVMMIQADTLAHTPLLARSIINKFVVLGRSIYVATDYNGICRLSGSELIQVKKNQQGKSYYFLSGLNDSLLIAGGGFNFFEILSTTGHTLYSYETPSVVNCGLTDAENNIWLGTGKGLLRFEFSSQYPSQSRLVALPKSLDIEFLRNNSIWDLLKDHLGNTWMATDKGLLCYRIDGSIAIYTNKDGLPSSTVTCLYEDKEKNIWIGTTQGLARLVTKNNYRQWTVRHGLLGDVLTGVGSLSPTELVVTSDGGAQLYSTISNQFSTIKKIPGGLSLSADKTGLILYNAGYMGTLDEKTRKVSGLTSMPPPPATCRDKDRRGWIYGCNNTDIYIYITINGKTYRDDSLPPVRFEKLLADTRGYLWVGTWGTGLYRFRYQVENGKLKKEFLDLNELLPAKEIRSLFEDGQGNIWVGTRHDGLFELINKGEDNYSIRHWGNREGLSSTWVISMTEDTRGNMWIGTYQGIDKLVRTSTGFRVFNFSDLNNVTPLIRDISIAGNDIWCATTEGLLRFTDDQADTISAPALWITSFSISGQDRHVTTQKADTVFHLKPKQNTVAFSFSAGSLLNEKRVLYSYRLLGGEDTSWSSPANTHTISYASLRPGRYRFEVLCFGLNGKPGEAKTISFTIHPPFTETVLFYVLCALALSLVLWLLYRYRIRQILRLQKVRSQIATDLHDDIGAALTNISILAELSKTSDQQNSFAQDLPLRIVEESTAAQQSLDDIIWSVNSNNDTLNQTMARMRRYAAQMLEPLAINCKIDFANTPADQKLNMEQRRDIYLVFKECLNNIIKHADAKNVLLEADVARDTLHLGIRDDGKGFDPLQNSDRNGLKNLQIRVKKWNGKILIESANGRGTCIDCYFQLSGSLK